ncbi:MAG: right-handed parallel beta-helix repeat-containing protein [Phycisphaerales bacterium]
MKLKTTLAVAISSLITPATLAGPLDPPPGPIESTMKTLTEVEPRTAINSTNTPGDSSSAFRITQSGSYYLAQNFSILGFLSNIDAIEIAASNVTIDLNGFTLTGLSGALNGIVTDGTGYRNIVIKNGTIQSFDTGIDLDGADEENITVEAITVINSDLTGIAIRNGRVSGCTVKDNGGSGIVVSNNSFVETCTVENNGSDGINAGIGSIIRDNIVRNNFNDGIRVSSRCIIRDNLVTQNGTQTGIKAGIQIYGSDSLIQSNVVVDNEFGLRSSTVSIFAQNIVSNNVIDIDISGSNPGLADQASTPNGAGAWDNIVP